MARRNADLLIVSLAAVAGMLAQAPAAPAVLRVVLGVPLLLLWPGYALAAVLFPRDTLGGAERAIFSLGLSLIAGILGAVILNWSPWDLTLAAWATLGGGLTVGASLLAYLRRSRRTQAATATMPSIGVKQLALMALAALMTIGAVGLSRVPAYAPDGQGYTLLWLTPETESGPPSLKLSVRSAELTTQSYRLVLSASGVTLAEWTDLSLTPGQTWEATTTIVGVPVKNNQFEARLYRMEEPGSVYRRVSWWGSE